MLKVMSFSDDDGATSMANTMDGAAISEPRVNDDDARSLWSLARGGAPLYDSLYPAELVVVIEKHFPINSTNAIDMCTTSATARPSLLVRPKSWVNSAPSLGQSRGH